MSEMAFTCSCEDLSIFIVSPGVPYAYWNYGGTPEGVEEPVTSNFSRFFAPETNLALKMESDEMVLAELTFL